MRIQREPLLNVCSDQSKGGVSSFIRNLDLEMRAASLPWARKQSRNERMRSGHSVVPTDGAGDGCCCCC